MPSQLAERFDAALVIAINSDPDAPIFNYCHYGLVADMDETCQAMLEALG